MRVGIELQQMTRQVLRVNAHAVVLIEQTAHDCNLALTHGMGDAALMPDAASYGSAHTARPQQLQPAALEVIARQAV
jgi:hypothetical protein